MVLDNVKHTEKHAFDPGCGGKGHPGSRFFFSRSLLHEQFAGLELVVHHEARGFM
jgi:hypothetical protein